MKKQGIVYWLLWLTLFAGSAMADTIGNGSGWCAPTNGVHVYTSDITSTINYDYSNPTNSVKEIHWNQGGTYAAQCDCDNSDYRGYNYFSADTGSLTVRGSRTDARYGGYTMHYYVLVTDKIEVGVETYIAGHLKQYVPIPYNNISNGDDGAGGCGTAVMNGMTAGSQGNVRLYIAAPLTGQTVIPSTKIMNLYMSKVSGNTASSAVPHIAEFYISGTITVPQSCTISAGQTIEVKFPDLRASDIRVKGASPNFAEQTTKVAFTCSNVADGSDISFALTGENDPHENSYLKTSNANIGIKITDVAGNTITPNGEARLPATEYADTKGSTTFKSRPVNTTGDAPNAGTYEAMATLTIKVE